MQCHVFLRINKQGVPVSASLTGATSSVWRLLVAPKQPGECSAPSCVNLQSCTPSCGVQRTLPSENLKARGASMSSLSTWWLQQLPCRHKCSETTTDESPCLLFYVLCWAMIGMSIRQICTKQGSMIRYTAHACVPCDVHVTMDNSSQLHRLQGLLSGTSDQR